MASSLITPIADALKVKLDALSFKTYRWPPKAMSGPGPFAVIEVPDVRRTPPQQSESQINVNDWDLDYTVTLYFVLKGDPATVSNVAVEALEDWIAAVDLDQGLGGLADDARVVKAERDYELAEKSSSRSFLVYETTVAVAAFV